MQRVKLDAASGCFLPATQLLLTCIVCSICDIRLPVPVSVPVPVPVPVPLPVPVQDIDTHTHSKTQTQTDMHTHRLIPMVLWVCQFV